MNNKQKSESYHGAVNDGEPGVGCKVSIVGVQKRDQGEPNCQQQGSRHPQPLCFVSAQMDPRELRQCPRWTVLSVSQFVFFPDMAWAELCKLNEGRRE